MIKRIPMEDWLRGCVYHDGRHGEVTLPTDKVLKIANYIQRTRRSTTDGLIDLGAVTADRKTEPRTERPCENCQEWDCYGCDYKQTDWTRIECYDGCEWPVGSPQCEGCDRLPPQTERRSE